MLCNGLHVYIFKTIMRDWNLSWFPHQCIETQNFSKHAEIKYCLKIRSVTRWVRLGSTLTTYTVYVYCNWGPYVCDWHSCQIYYVLEIKLSLLILGASNCCSLARIAGCAERLWSTTFMCRSTRFMRIQCHTVNITSGFWLLIVWVPHRVKLTETPRKWINSRNCS